MDRRPPYAQLRSTSARREPATDDHLSYPAAQSGGQAGAGAFREPPGGYYQGSAVQDNHLPPPPPRYQQPSSRYSRPRTPEGDISFERPSRAHSPFAAEPLMSPYQQQLDDTYALTPDSHRFGNEGYYPNQDESYPLTQYPPQPMLPDPYSQHVAFEGRTGEGSESAYGYAGHDDFDRPLQMIDEERARLGMSPSNAPNGPQIRRFKTVKRVELYRGNLVLDCPIPNRLIQSLPNRDDREFTHMRYTAATCDPKDFLRENFTLRQVLYSQPRSTELFIVITMYNEDEKLFSRTMNGVMKNIAHLCSRDRSKVWGKDGWKKVVVCIVSDGRTKINPRTLSVLAGMGVYQDGIAKNIVNGKPVTAHIYEYTTQVSITPDVKFKRGDKGTVPVQILFCLKEKNQKKINSHRWFFQAFGAVLQPNICVLVDAGTRPSGTSIYHLWKAFDLNRNVGGACGEIKVMKGTAGKALLNPLVATQNFEYKMSNILDKPLESAFGFISVLPGAFSAYRYIALQNDANGLGPLEKYFKGETMHGANAGIFTANMYLAEDRILCFELLSKRKSRWVLQYVKSSSAETDVPDDLAELILQRRRWLNGSFFAAVYSLAHTFQIWRSDHSFIRKIMLHIEFLYQLIYMLFSWFAIGNFFLVFRILTVSLGDPSAAFAPGAILSVVFEWLYLASLATCFVLSMGNRPQGTKLWYSIMAGFWAILMGYLLFAAVYLSVRAVQSAIAGNGGHFTAALIVGNSVFRNLVVSLCATYALYFVASFLFFEPWHMFTSFVQYLLMSPSYVNILNVYAFCNTHDISWGTKGDDKISTDLGVAHTKEDGTLEVEIPTEEKDLDSAYETALQILATKAKPVKKKRSETEKQEDYYKGFRSSVVLTWMFSNGALCAVVLNVGGIGRVTTETGVEKSTIYLAVILWSVAALSAFRFLGALWFLIVRIFRGV